jgi:lipopolysaccharide export system permease protein
LASLGVLTAVIWTTQALKDFDLLTTKGQSLVTFLAVTALGIPSLVMIIAPVALFIAVLYSLNKLNSDSELIVMSAAGLSPYRLMRPFAVLTILATLLVAAMSLYAMPWSFRELRDLIMKIRADFISHVVREGTFTTLDQGFIFHSRERARDGSLRGILMEDRRDPEHITSYVADQGATYSTEDENYLVLNNGSVQRHQPSSKDAAIIIFKRYALDLAQFGAEGGAAPLKPREYSTRELFNLDRSNIYVKMQEGKLRAELHDRFISPLYAIAFGMIAFAALGQARTTRQGRSTAILYSVGIVLLLRIAGFGASGLVGKTPVAVGLIYAIPLVGFVIACLYAFGPPVVLPWPKPVRAFVAKPA